MAPDETSTTRWPRLRRRNRSSTRVSSQARFTRPLSASTSSAEPTFTTTHRACVRRATESERCAVMTKIIRIRAALPNPTTAPTLVGGENTDTGWTFAVSRDYEPVPGQWYENLEEEESFRVLSVDEDSELVEIEYLDGDVEEIDLETWHEMDLERTTEPEGWTGSAEDDDEEEEKEEDWDEDEDDDDDDDFDEDEEEDEGRDEY